MSAIMSLKSFAVALTAVTLFSGASASPLVAERMVAKRNQEAAEPSCTSSFTSFTYAGCYQDPSDPRALLYSSGLDTSSMTVEKCVAFCKGNNYRYAGLEYYGECFCGAAINGPKIDESNCNFPCSGNSSEVCGGNDIISVYQDPTFKAVDNSTISDWQSLGCYSEVSGGRALNWQQTQISSSEMTIEVCLQACKNGGYDIAGVEYGSECFCGVVLNNGSVPVESSNCNIACYGINADGHQEETCGGSSFLNLYVATDMASPSQCGQALPSLSYTTASTPTSTTVASTSSSSSSTSSSVPTTTKTSTSSSSSSSSSSSTSSPAPVTTSTSSTSSKSSSSSSSSTSSPAPVTTSPSSSSSQPSTSSTTSTSSSSTSTNAVKKPVPFATTSATSSNPAGPTTSSSSKPTTTSSKTTASLCTATSTHSPTSTCEYKCGNWCSRPMATFGDQASCLTAYSDIKTQLASCFTTAGWPDSLKCFDYSTWVSNVQSYCKASCPGSGCSNTGCKGKYPPSSASTAAATATVSTSVFGCISGTPTAKPSTTSSSTSTTKSYVPIPTCTNICQQANNPSKGYSSSSPVGGIEMPLLTCNNDRSTYSSSGSCFKLYTDKESSKCSSYGRSGSSGASQGCADACQSQYNSCVSTYARGCSSNSFKNGESYNSANTKCQNQLADCKSANSNIQVSSSKCGSYNNGW